MKFLLVNLFFYSEQLEIINSVYNFKPTTEIFLTIGTFDGVHVGHKKIVKKLVNESKLNNKKSVLLTFFPHPRMVLQKDASIKLINTIEEKAKLLEEIGLDCFIINEFTSEFSNLTALEFVRDILINQLNTSKLIIGYDHHFGKNREGNIKQLTKYSNLYNFSVEQIPAQDINNVSISSTVIRDSLAKGDIKKANKFLGYNFMISGKVVKGKSLGRKIGFPTANINISEKYKLMPKKGVYIIKSNIKGKVFFGMMNIGNRPTIEGSNQTIEVHFFNFNKNLYAEKLTVELLFYIREEKKFNSINMLSLQLKKDKKFSENYLLKKYK